MRNSKSPYTIFEFIVENLALLETLLSELVAFSSSSKNIESFSYDLALHRFKPIQGGILDFIAELKISIEDLASYTKTIFRSMYPLIEYLNYDEAQSVNLEIYKLVRKIEIAHETIASYISTHEISTFSKQEMIYHCKQIKDLVNECRILEIEVDGADREVFTRQDVQKPQYLSRSNISERSKQILQKVTKDVDQMIRQVPFVISDEKRARLIEERYQRELEG